MDKLSKMSFERKNCLIFKTKTQIIYQGLKMYPKYNVLLLSNL